MTIVRRKGFTPCKNDVLVVVDRTSPFGNPFSMRSEKERDEVCDKFKAYMDKRLEEGWKELEDLRVFAKKKSHEGKTVILLCHCYPKRCHAMDIANFIEWR